MHLDLWDTVSFKPCYKWNTFNTSVENFLYLTPLLPCFKPCYKWNTFNTKEEYDSHSEGFLSFKPCYKWNTFNTETYFIHI